MVPIGFVSLVWCKFRRAVGPRYNGLTIRREDVDCVPEFVVRTRKPCFPDMVPTASSMGWNPDLDGFAIAKS